MTEEGEAQDPASKAELKAELRRTRTRLRAMEKELTETNEGMVALTLELENAKERYQTIFEESTDGILLIDPDEDTIHEVNPLVCDILGYDRDTLVELTPDDIFTHKSGESSTFAEAVVRGWAKGFTCRTQDGRNINVDISASMVTLDNRSLLLASLRDVTQRKRREQRLQVLTRIFRHNLRNDGNVIQGYTDLLADGLSNSELQANALQIRQTIDELLDLSSKVRRTQDVLDQTQIRTSPIQDIFSYQQEWFGKAYPEATLETKPLEHDLVVARRLRVAIEEIVENAARHADKAVAITIEAELIEERVVIIIEDDGPGIPNHELEAMRSGGESPLSHGSGIGLWLVHWVVDSVGGDLTVQSQDSGGTRFSMAVPRESTERPRAKWNEIVESESP